MSTTAVSVLLGVCGMFGWGLYDFLGGVLSKRIGSFVPLFWSQAVGAVTIATVAVVAAVVDAAPPVGEWAASGGLWQLPVRAMLLVSVAAVLYCGGYLFFFAGFTKGSVSIVAATMNLWAVVTMVVAFVVVGQRLTTVQTVGAAVIIAGATLASIDWAAARLEGVQASAGVRETLVGAVLFGLYWNVSEAASEDIGWLRTTALIKLAVVLVLLAIAVTTGRRLLPDRGAEQRPASAEHRPASAGRRDAGLLAGMGLVEVSAVAAVNYGLEIGNAILITPIASALSVVTIALAVILLRERISPLQAIGMALAVGGIITTAL